MKIMYLDEAGSHSLEVIERDFPVFVLGGVIVERRYLIEIVEPRLRELKIQFFGRDDFILHTADIVRARGDFASLRDQELKRSFLDALTQLMRDLEYVVVACVIRKAEYAQKSQILPSDLYPLSLELLAEEFCREIGDSPTGGLIYAERRRPDLDLQLELAWERYRRFGPQDLHSTLVSKRVIEFVLKDKRVQNVGLQLADLVVSPIGRAIAGYPRRSDWDALESKFRREGGTYLGVGLKVLPGEKEREAGDR